MLISATINFLMLSVDFNVIFVVMIYMLIPLDVSISIKHVLSNVSDVQQYKSGLTKCFVSRND